MVSEISKVDFIKAHFYYWKNFFQMILNVSRTYSNYFIVLKKVLSGNFPVKLIMRNGRCTSIHTFNAMYVLTFTRNLKSVYCDVENDLVSISTKMLPQNKIIFHGGVNNGDLVHGFLQEDYGKLPIKNKTIIDIGSNIGDTPIYFALHGAKKVIGLEPFPKNYDLSNKNIIENNLSDKITILLAGCSSKNGTITINPDYESNHESKLIEFEHGKQIPLMTLEDILKQYNVPDESILKMDCEGCENDIILSATKELLQKFSHMQIEYHVGYRTLKDKLEDSGFSVSITGPVAIDVLHTLLQSIQEFLSVFGFKKTGVNTKDNVQFRKKHKIGYTGFIFAKKIM
ncbi:MAG: FkbM family methyltransferase [Nitrosarchaeum sp.]|nr:MAG: FkbM family methyltransferase [Nitrosarchaeum sp.]